MRRAGPALVALFFVGAAGVACSPKTSMHGAAGGAAPAQAGAGSAAGATAPAGAGASGGGATGGKVGNEAGAGMQGGSGAAGSDVPADAGASGGAGTVAPPHVDCGDAPALSAGMKTETLQVGGEMRSYLVVVPASLDARVRAPVLIGFHGGSGTAENAHRSYGLAGDEAALYVYPQAISWPEAGGVAWNVDPNGHDLPYFDALVADLGEKYCIDDNRVFAAGQSNGAFFVNALGCYRPEVIRAIASVAGGGPPGQCKGSVPAMIVHGTADTTVTIDKGMFSRDYWLAANGCADAASMPDEITPCVRYSGCAEPVLWCEHPGGHPWPDFAGAAIRQFLFGLR
jgi:polyhydroxybutyrate depolymerase